MSKDSAGWGRWATSIDELVTYRYLGCRSEVVDSEHARGRMPLRSDMRWGAGPRGMPLAVAMLDTAGINIDGIRFAALTHVAMQIHDGAADVGELRIDGEVSRLGRTGIFTEAILRDSSTPDRVVATGTADWISMGEVTGWAYIDPGPGVPDEPSLPPLIDAYHVEPLGDGGYMIPALAPAVGDQLLHHGPLMAALEAHATDLAARHADADELVLQTFDIRLLRGGTTPPFVTKTRDSGHTSDAVWTQSELVGAGGEGEVVARALLVHGRSA